MLEYLKLYLAVNAFDLKRRLRLDLAPESKWLIQSVMVYNMIVWSIFTLQARSRFRHTLGHTPKKPLSLFTEIRFLFFKTFNQDSNYLEYRTQLRIYLGFWLILFAFTYLVFQESTWTMPLHVRLPLPFIALAR